jgi:imidazoleglycerol-phosphate dehydratase / histidinol-phosphatase
MNAIISLARPEIVTLKPYSHAAWRPSLTRLHANEAPWRPSGDTTAAGLNRYPEPQPQALIERLGKVYGVPAASVLATHGSDEAIDLLSRIYLRAGTDAILQCTPTFGMYQVAARIQGGGVLEIPLVRAQGWSLDPERLLAAWQPNVKLVYLCSPNNPTANLLDVTALEEVCRVLDERAIVVIDEAYIEWSRAQSLGRWLDRFPTLAILRTLSKAHALAGARVGALLAHPALIELARRVVPPYSLSQPAVEAALRALQPAELAASADRIAGLLSEREYLHAGLAASPLVERVWPSDANFLLIDCRDCDVFMNNAAAGGLIVRDMRAHPLLPRSLRVSVGTRAQNDALLHSILFLDRDGTLNEETPDEQIDRLEKVRLMPGVVPALLELKHAGFGFVMVTNQDGLGTPAFPRENFDRAHQFILHLLGSQGIEFEAICICPHYRREDCDCRKPRTGMVREFLAAQTIDKSRSFMIGDRDTDMEFAANLGVQGLKITLGGEPPETWPAIARRILGPARHARVHRKTKETDIHIDVDLSRDGPSSISTGLGFFDHMLEQVAKHGGFALDLSCTGDLHIDEHHTIEDCALGLGAALREALGDKTGIARYGFLLAMDEAEAQIALDLSGRPFFVWEGTFNRERVGEMPTELVPHFFRSLAESLGAALHIRVRGENTHHMIESCFKGVGRSLRQAIRLEGRDLPSTKGSL